MCLDILATIRGFLWIKVCLLRHILSQERANVAQRRIAFFCIKFLRLKIILKLWLRQHAQTNHTPQKITQITVQTIYVPNNSHNSKILIKTISTAKHIQQFLCFSNSDFTINFTIQKKAIPLRRKKHRRIFNYELLLFA